MELLTRNSTSARHLPQLNFIFNREITVTTDVESRKRKMRCYKNMREPFHTDILRWIMTSLCTFVIINDVRLLKRTTTTTTNSQNEITLVLDWTAYYYYYCDDSKGDKCVDVLSVHMDPAVTSQLYLGVQNTQRVIQQR